MHSRLRINELRLDVFLGTTPKEREKKQTVDVEISFIFKSLPKGCFTDKISDTLCYDEIAKKIELHFTDKHFCLIEALGYSLYSFLKRQFAKNTGSSINKINIKIKKHPKIITLSSTVFSIGNF